MAQDTKQVAEEAIEATEAVAQQSFQDMFEAARSWVEAALDQLMSISSVWQILAILAAALLAWVASRRPKARLRARIDKRETQDIIYKILHAIEGIIWPAITVIFLWIAMFIFRGVDLPNDILRIAASLTNAAIVVRLLTRNMEEGPLRTLISLIAWGIAALYIVKLLTPVTAALESAAVTVGGTRISVLQVITSLVVASFALWFGRVAGNAVQTQVRSTPRLTPSMAGLLGQVAKIGLMILAVMIALGSVGIPLTAFAFFSGAIAFGVGFGLQSIFSNFISGIIILFEKSIKVGDFIELQSGVRGQVREINIRSTLVTTNDSVDILVPNEEFIKAQVINWTLRDPRRRLRIDFGVAYGTDKEVVKKAALEAAKEVEWTDWEDPNHAPDVWLVQFGDSSLNYQLVVWLKPEAVSRPGGVNAAYNWALHTALEKYGLEIPFPQRDINIRQPAEITVKLDQGTKPKRSK
ncbi:mechanosensitive ion channel family protein [Litorimonas sp. RW-G-Af-16]|uniref:mechanosensitive ion channel family protein n=1 Tax=Litorimonas sp. RW-G-Af-16 TaxID=3241168 RepID=UPI00390C9435